MFGRKRQRAPPHPTEGIMIVETKYHDRFREIRDRDLERAWRRRELARLARANRASMTARALAALRSMRRNAAATNTGPTATESPERAIPWSA
jgi:chromosome condensin MukBEF ATPase and DNA-binding subunit MukB